MSVPPLPNMRRGVSHLRLSHFPPSSLHTSQDANHVYSSASLPMTPRLNDPSIKHCANLCTYVRETFAMGCAGPPMRLDFAPTPATNTNLFHYLREPSMGIAQTFLTARANLSHTSRKPLQCIAQPQYMPWIPRLFSKTYRLAKVWQGHTHPCLLLN